MLVTVYENISPLAKQRCPVASVRASDVTEISAVRKPDLNYESPRMYATPEERWMHRDEETKEVWREEFEVRLIRGETYLLRFLFPREAYAARRDLIAEVNGDQRHKEQQDQLRKLAATVDALNDSLGTIGKTLVHIVQERINRRKSA